MSAETTHREHECPAAAAVAGLAREVEALRRGMQQVASAGEVARLARVVAELSETTAAGARPGGEEPEAPPSWLCWSGDAERASGLLADLTAWLGDVYLRYADAAESLPECWLWHPEVVEELVWLMQAWLAAYVGEGACVRLAGDWHDRLRPGAVRRIKHYAPGCSLENHLPGRAKPAPVVPVVDAADAVAAWWADHRDQAAPAPTQDQIDEAARAERLARGGTR